MCSSEAKAYIFDREMSTRLTDTIYGFKATMNLRENEMLLRNGIAQDVLFKVISKPLSYEPKVMYRITDGKDILYELIGDDSGNIGLQCSIHEPGRYEHTYINGKPIVTLSSNKDVFTRNPVMVHLSDQTFRGEEAYKGAAASGYMRVLRTGSKDSVCYDAHELVPERMAASMRATPNSSVWEVNIESGVNSALVCMILIATHRMKTNNNGLAGLVLKQRK